MGRSNEDIRAEQARYFIAINRVGEPQEVLSPSGRFRLLIRTYRTGPGTWNYTRGTVTRVSDGAAICDIPRNYSQFHHTFVTKDEREYLITGRSYMSQTIVDLDRVHEYEPDGDQYQGAAFCWAKCALSPDGNTLAVDGCIWACPYEIRFFDFTDPAKGWPELSLEGIEVIEDPVDSTPSRWLDATTFEAVHLGEDGAEKRSCLQRRGARMVLL